MPDTPQDHVYLSTGCFHGDHDYCKAMTGLNGAKRPAECKKCGAKCVCPCHQEQLAPATDTATATPDWEHKGDGIWTLPVDGGTVLYTTRSTPEGRAQFAEEWAKGTKPEPDGTDVAEPPVAPTFTGNELKALRLCIAAALSQHVLVHRDDQIPDCCTEAVLTVVSREMERLQGQITDLQRSNSVLGRDAVRCGERSMQLAVTLQQVLGHFVHKGHPGEPCLQTDWISVKTVDRWRAVLNPPKDGNK